jgi:photosystem II stability/assembly factor-like uncharacterized protein
MRTISIMMIPNLRQMSATVLGLLALMAVPGHTIAAQENEARPARFDSGTISGLSARNIGSAVMSGRIAAIDAFDDNGKVTVFAGSASGGVWKSINGATTFKPVFDHESVQSIGAITIDPSNHKIVWVGTGEGWTRNSTSIGNGIYKSTDSGENWTNVGLKDSERIARILVDPSDSNTVYACATGHLWNDSDERGVYKTVDGGKTWKKVLAGANGSTGCAMLSMSAKEPKTVYASMWDFRRQGWTFRSGGPGSGLFKSTDGGDHWTELSSANNKGLPEKPYGRIAVAVAPSKPNVVYAMIESKQSSLYRSDDGGKTWTKGDSSQYMVWRPFYFANLIVDPKDENKVFKPDLILLVSTDGGRSFSSTANAHGDFHTVWIDPSNTNIIFAGDDGGFWSSIEGGTRWAHAWNLPVSQFYHVSTDDASPYHVYGGLQDNSVWVADSSYPGGISNSRWENIYGGDGMWVFPDPSDPTYIVTEYQGGEIARINRYTLEGRNIKPQPGYKEKRLHFNWNTPIHMSPNEKGTMYIGAQYLFRSRDHGQSWERISPDLSTNDPEKQKQEESGGITVDNSAAEMHTSIYSISESPKNGQLIWAGTDDGNLQITRNGGKTWTNVTANVPGLGKNSWVSTIKAGLFDEGTAYATFDRHTFGDMAPYAYKTTDFGKTWTPLVTPDSGVRGYAHVITEDTVDPKLLFLGTEFGLWISIDGGAHWAQYKGSNFPAAAVRDIVIQPRESDLVLATHGRGIWIIDDISSLRSLTPELMAKDAVLLESTGIQYINANGGWSEGDSTFFGASRTTDAYITYYQKSRHIFGDLKIEIFDQDGKLMDTIAGSKHRGLNRTTWSMRLKPPAVPPAATAAFEAATGPRVLPGIYTVKMTKGDQVYTAKLHVEMDTRAKYTDLDRRAQYELSMKLYKLLGRLSYAVDSMASVRDGATLRAAKMQATDPLRKNLEQLSQQADALRSKIVATKEGGAITGEQRLREFTTETYGNVTAYDGRPTDDQVARTDALSRELDDVIHDLDQLTRQLPAINTALQRKKLEPIQTVSQEQWDKAHGEGASAAGVTRWLEKQRGEMGNERERD